MRGLGHESRCFEGTHSLGGLGVAILAARLYFCGYAETGVPTFACAVGLVGAAGLGIVALIALSWVIGGLWRDVIRLRPSHDPR